MTTKSTGHAIGKHCRLCGLVVSIACADLTWDMAVMKAKVDPLFLAELRGARAVAGGGMRTFIPQTLALLKEFMSTTERWQWLLTEDEFIKKHGISFKDVPQLQAMVHTHVDENNAPITGVLLPHADHPGRLVRTMDIDKSQVSSLLMEPSAQYRADQGLEMQSHYMKERKAQTDPKKTCKSASELEEWVADAKKKKEQEESLLPGSVVKQEQVEPEPAPLARAEPQEEELDHVGSTHVMAAISSVAVQSGKGKGQGKGKKHQRREGCQEAAWEQHSRRRSFLWCRCWQEACEGLEADFVALQQRCPVTRRRGKGYCRKIAVTIQQVCWRRGPTWATC